MNMKIVKGLMFIKVGLRKIEVIKKLFILDLEQGTEVFLNSVLSQSKYPMTFRFYDSILNHCQNSVSQKTKDIYKFKNLYRLNFFKNENMKLKVM